MVKWKVGVTASLTAELTKPREAGAPRLTSSRGRTGAEPSGSCTFRRTPALGELRALAVCALPQSGGWRGPVLQRRLPHRRRGSRQEARAGSELHPSSSQRASGEAGLRKDITAGFFPWGPPTYTAQSDQSSLLVSCVPAL